MGLRYLKFVGFLAVCLLAACDSFEHLFFEQVRVQMDETDSVTISCAASRFNGDLLVDVTVSNGCAYAVNLPTSEACITVDGDPVTLLSSLGVSLATNVLPYSSLQSSARVITRGSRQSLMDAARHGRLGMMIVIESTTSTNRICFPAAGCRTDTLQSNAFVRYAISFEVPQSDGYPPLPVLPNAIYQSALSLKEKYR